MKGKQTTLRKTGPVKTYAAILICFLLILLASSTLAEARWPADPGRTIKSNGKLKVDIAYAEDGYLWAAVQKKSSKKMKLRVTHKKETLTYNLNSEAEYETIPLQMGDGKYELSLFENIAGTKYSAAGKISIKVKLNDPEGCFYYPNVFVNYQPETEAVAKSDELCAGKAGAEAYDAVHTYIVQNYRYDFIRAMKIQPGETPDIDTCYEKKKGICQDLSALTCCMLRVQEIPARLMIGYADNNYHAWVEFDLDGKHYRFDPTAEINGSKVKVYSTERFY